jgi:RNase adaptor protein for sRNA GlmZ degradation
MVDNVITRLNNIEEACRNDFGNISSEFTSIKTSIEALRNEMIQRYAIAQRLHHSFSSESSSSQLSDSALEENRSRFKRVFNSNKEVGDTMDYAFETVRRETREVTGEKIGKGTVKSFYYGEGDPKFNTVMSIMRWVDNKEITNSLAE